MNRKSEAVLPVFLNHAGCKGRCIYCNQTALVGSLRSPAEQIEKMLGQFTPSNKRPFAVIAFYGGDFTALPESERRALIRAVDENPNRSLVSGFRCSTRPDSIDRDAIEFLRTNRFSVVEIGAQCMDDRLLERIGRMHTVADVQNACALVKEGALDLGVHLMIGLPGQSEKAFLDDCEKVAGLRPDFVRLFPTTPLRGTELGRMFECGEFLPLSLDQAREQAEKAMAYFLSEGIRAAQIGLHPSEPMTGGDSVLGGPFHPRFGEMVRGGVFRKAARLAIEEASGKNVVLYCSQAVAGAIVGKGREGIADLIDKAKLGSLKITGDESVGEGRFVAVSEKGRGRVSASEVWQKLSAGSLI